jgi:hypothetical protein
MEQQSTIIFTIVLDPQTMAYSTINNLKTPGDVTAILQALHSIGSLLLVELSRPRPEKEEAE